MRIAFQAFTRAATSSAVTALSPLVSRFANAAFRPGAFSSAFAGDFAVAVRVVHFHRLLAVRWRR